MDDVLKKGDIVIDLATNDVGLLVERYSLLSGSIEDMHVPFANIWAWEIYWTGPDNTTTHNISRYQPYTEEGLLNLIRTGTFQLKKRKIDG